MMDNDQTAAFLSARCGKLTASNMATAMETKKDGTPTKARADLQRAVLAERLTGSNVRNYVTPAMEFGLAMEDDAKSAYEAWTGNLIREAGTFDHPTIDMFAATPDALMGDGLVEFKVPQSSTFVDWCLQGVVPDQHKPQMLAQMACTGRKWCEFVAFDPRVRDHKRRLFIRRYEPKPEEIAAVEAAAETFLAEVDALWEQLTAVAA